MHMSREQINQAMRDNNDHQFRIDVIRAVCINANPNRGWVKEVVDSEGDQEPVRLADVLRAIDKAQPALMLLVSTTGRFYDMQENGLATNFLAQWNLRGDDLYQQSRETVKFLYKLIK